MQQSTTRPSARSLQRRRRQPRRAVAVILALGLLAITLTIAYTLLRTQATSSMIQANANRRASARQAALTGLSIALHKIHDPAWQGVTVPLAGNLNAEDSYAVSFLPGDESLTAGDDDYEEYPYRLTLRSVGTSVDPADPQRQVQHTAEVVVQLVRERMTTAPASWPELLNHTVTQWQNTTAEINFPMQVNGSARFDGTMQFCEDIPPLVRPFDGLIDEVALLDASLSATELLSLYEGNSSYGDHVDDMLRWWRFDDAAGSTTAAERIIGNAGTYEGAEPVAIPGPAGGAGSAEFNGEVDGISVGSVDVVGPNMTVMAWFKADDFGTSDARIISKAIGTNEADHWWMLSTVRSSGAQRLRFRLKSLFGTTKTLIASSGNLNAGQWYFAAATFDGWNMRLYLNGEEVGNTTNFGWVGINPLVPTWIGENAPGSGRGMYFRHLNQMQAAGFSDQRPFPGGLTVRSHTLDSAARSLLSEELATAIIDDPSAVTADYSQFAPAEVTEYQLYPGGPTYDVESLAGTVANQQLTNDVRTNPLGVRRATSDLQLGDNVQLEGVLLADRDLELAGSNIEIAGLDLPAIEGTSELPQIPCLQVGRDLEYSADSTVQSSGMLVVAASTRFKSGDHTMTSQHVGRLSSGTLAIEARQPWAGASASDWNSALLLFEQQRIAAGGTNYLPEWLETHGFSSNPHITFDPPSATIRYHWHDWSSPLFLPAVDGEGLRWSVVRWNDTL